MRISDRSYRQLKRTQVLTGVVPVGLFLLSHFSINARAIAGREAYARMVGSVARIPGLVAWEILAIGLPLAIHITLGPLLATTRQASLEPATPGPRSRALQRATGFYLAMYLAFHVWALRLAPERLSGRRELFDLVADQLRNPAVFTLQALAVIAAAAHFLLGCLALAAPGAPGPVPRGARLARAAGVAGFIVLSLVGLNALLAFVWAPARWLVAR